MCSIEEAWAGQTFSGKQVVSQGDIHKSYMSLPDDVMTHNNSFSMKNNESSTSREFTRGINSKYSREPRVPKINRNSNDANINISSTIQPLNNYGGINPRPPYMEVYDNASGPSPIMTGENFTDIENAYNVSNTVNNFMERGMTNEMTNDMSNNMTNNMTNNLLNEDTYEESDIINNKFTNRENKNNFANIKQSSKYNSSDRNMNNTNNTNNTNETSNNAQVLFILQQVLSKLDKLEKELHHQQTRNMYDIVLYILIGMILSFILYSICTSIKK
jgi:hypothetical protein